MRRIAILMLAAWGPAVFGQVTVPFVGCKANGQLGPVDAPFGKDPVLPISAQAARRLAYYSGTGAVLAPRGWYCFGGWGSDGEVLRLAPQPFDASAQGWKGFAGPAVEVQRVDSGAFGRFEVASIVARVFPTQWAFARQVAAEDIIPGGPIVFGPYPQDKLTYKDESLVEYTTPAQTDGLGTESALKKGADPIRGVAILSNGHDGPDVLLLSVRLPAELRDLTDTIIRQVESENAPNH